MHRFVNSEISPLMLFVHIVSGLWLTDITITQIMQERIIESKRGAINGVQDSLNQSFDMLKSVLVIIFPFSQQFGGLVLLSFLFIVSG